MTAFANHISALLVTGASLLMCLLLLGLWRVSPLPRERFLLLASIAQLIFALHQIPLFFDASAFAGWTWRAGFAALFGLYVGLTVMVANLLLRPPSRFILRGVKIYLWFVVPVSFYIFGVFDFTGYISTIYVQHRLTINTLIALLVNVSLALLVMRRFYVMQQQLLQTRMDAGFALERATLTERQRIMSDIHDNVGSQLVGVLSLIRSGAAHAQLEAQTTAALQSLRIAVDAIQPVNGNLAAVLATLRHRLQPSLNAAGIALVWRVDDLPRMTDLTPQKIQHIQRIVTEAFSNAIQYSKAATVKVTAQWQQDQSRIVIGISDDGVGMSSDMGRGQGLSNMAFRAEALGGKIRMENISGAGQTGRGFAVTLEIPCLPA